MECFSATLMGPWRSMRGSFSLTRSALGTPWWSTSWIMAAKTKENLVNMSEYMRCVEERCGLWGWVERQFDLRGRFFASGPWLLWLSCGWPFLPSSFKSSDKLLFRGGVPLLLPKSSERLLFRPAAAALPLDDGLYPFSLVEEFFESSCWHGGGFRSGDDNPRRTRRSPPLTLTPLFGGRRGSTPRMMYGSLTEKSLIPPASLLLLLPPSSSLMLSPQSSSSSEPSPVVFPSWSMSRSLFALMVTCTACSSP
mmetsp:Transcript_4610/g.11607  ORF Transcript_4610/g.11607 Transcript_4610/m.11607 type:complete len:252 (+) Transcript_4610:525-1280(+)